MTGEEVGRVGDSDAEAISCFFSLVGRRACRPFLECSLLESIIVVEDLEKR